MAQSMSNKLRGHDSIHELKAFSNAAHLLFMKAAIVGSFKSHLYCCTDPTACKHKDLSSMYCRRTGGFASVHMHMPGSGEKSGYIYHIQITGGYYLHLQKNSDGPHVVCVCKASHTSSSSAVAQMSLPTVSQTRDTYYVPSFFEGFLYFYMSF